MARSTLVENSTKSITLDLEPLLEVARMTLPEGMRQRAPRYGSLGACTACRQPALTHFDSVGRFLGCTSVPEDAVFVLMPLTSAGRLVTPTRVPASTRRHTRRFRVARYTPAPTPAETVSLTDRRSLVRDVVLQAGDAGVREAEVVDRLGIPRGSVSEALAWLHAHQLIDKREDSDSNT